MSGLASFLTLPFLAWSFYVDLPTTPFLIAISFLFLVSLFPLRSINTLKSGLIFILGLLYFLGQKETLLFYPVLASAAVCLSFAISNFYPPCLVLRIAKKMEPDMPLEAESYCKVVNNIWIVILALNTAISFWTVAQNNLALWSWYNGFVSYLLIATFMVIEYCVRRVFKSRFEANNIRVS